ncbi:adenylate/guanylate cyclase domain-containing protein [Pedobacter cryoconitis]|uniref:Adenylate cyclase n=1 Tax=Pedobacter cryoconitis TaxID=188932 RepID=A0A327TBY8_9SPHI|nr:adenylate/guanylate cyclase domain-containing protein [Pedobacter cryoconitis]RAJ37143.1 adenylate cyclase [Pedobacter cryoconitis]
MKTQNSYIPSTLPTHQISCTRLTDQTIVCKSPDKMKEIYTALGEERELALLFLDIRNFTAAMEIRSSYEVIYMIRKLFVLFNRSITEAGGRIVETNGDSIYAVFGLDTNLKMAVQAAVDTAYALLRDVEVFNASYAQPYFNLSYEIGIGVHHGKVVVGQYDLTSKEQLTVMGLPVNIASRLQGETKGLHNNLIVSKLTYDLLTDPKDAELKSVQLKGISAAMNVMLMGNTFHPENYMDDMDLNYYLGISG